MATNFYFSQKVKSEQDLYEDIIIESLKIYGQDVYYLPRSIINEDRILGEDIPSSFNSSYKIEMYIENIEGFDGEGDLFTKFGVEIRDQATFIVARKRWKRQVGRIENQLDAQRPREGDLIYLPLSNSMFQIMHVEHEQPFYQLSNLPVYKMRCELFEYNNEDFDTGIDTIDGIEKSFAYRYLVSLKSKRTADITAKIENGEIVDGNVINGGENYDANASITFTNPNLSAQTATATATIDSFGSINGITLDLSGRFYNSATVTVSTPEGADSSLDSAQLVANVEDGEVTSISILDSGLNYPSAPTIVISDPDDSASSYRAEGVAVYDDTTLQISSINITYGGKFYTSAEAFVDAPKERNFEIGTLVTQTLANGITMTGEVAYWSGDSNVVTVVHVGADSDGTTQGYHNFAGDLILNGEDNGTLIKWFVDSVSEEYAEKTNAKINDFETTSDDLGFIDFSETNPFGDPR